MAAGVATPLSPEEKMNRSAALVLLALAISLCAGAAAGAEAAQAPPPKVWVADSLTKISPEGKPFTPEPRPGYSEKNAVWDGASGTAAIEAAGNEYVAFQVMIEGGRKGLKEVKVEAGPLASDGASIPAENFTLYGEYYTKVTRPSESPAQSMGPGWYPDGLVPLSLERFATFPVEPEVTRGVWVDLYVPAGTPPGFYSGEVKVSAAGREPAVVKLALTVWDFELPAESHLRWHFGYNENLASAHGIPFDRRTSHVSDEFLDLELDFYRLCRRHRVTPTTHYTTPIPDHKGRGADLEIDWESYDRRFGRYLDGSAFEDGIPVNIFSLPVNAQSYGGWPSSTNQGRRSDLGGVNLPLARYRPDLESFRKALELTVRHWEEKGWNLEDTFVYVADEPPERLYPVIKDHCRIAREVDDRIHTCMAFYRVFGTRGAAVVKEFRDYITYWSVAGDYMDTTAFEGMRREGDWIGIYQGSAPFEGGEAIDMDGVALVTWPWIAWKYDLDALYIYMGTMWETADIWDIPENQGWRTNSQGVLVYPGAKVGLKRVLPTMRLKQMRRGMQDYEYMRLSAAAAGRAQTDAVVNRIIPAALQDASPGNFGDRHFGPGKWEHDAAEWIKARREMARAIAGEAATGPRDAPR